MAPLTKDSVEVANPGGEAAVQQPQAGAPAKPAAAGGGHLRADAVSLEVPVKVHGSRVTEVARGVAPRTEPFEEETSTMIVFPQGAVLRMSTAVSASQMLVVTNLKTRQDAICRVLKVRTFSNMQGYVEVEFTHKQPGYWGAIFPGEGPAPSIPAAAPVAPVVAPTVSAESPVTATPAQNAAPIAASLPTVAPPTIAPPAVAPTAPVAHVVPPTPVVAAPPPVAPPPAGFVAPSKPEPTFAQIGTQEEVQPAASATTPAAVKFVAPMRPVAATPAAPTVSTPPTAQTPPAPVPTPVHAERVVEKIVAETPKLSVAAQALADAHIEIAPEPAAPASTLSLTELRGDEPSAAGVLAAVSETLAGEEKEEESAAAGSWSGSALGTFGSFSGGAALGGSRAASSESFGARLDGSLDASASQAGQPRGNNWMLIAACVVLLFAGVFGGVFYFRTHSATPANNSAAKPNAPALPQQLAFQSPSDAPEQPVQSNAATRNSATHPVTIVTQSNAPAVTVSSSSAASGLGPRVVSPEKQNSKITADMMQQQLQEHPTAPQRGDAGQAEAAPALDPAASGDSSNSGALNGIVSSNVPALAAPEIRPDGDGPVKVGGNVKEPRLLSRVMPEYPLVAKEAGIQGDVVIKTTIDAKGNVVNVQVVSGPQMLRGPALAALRRWKYVPSTLNDEPIAVQMLVTIKFSR
ncbi:MAG: energy transducer TonB [Candidatus Acidiferrales bacterium]